MSKINLSTDLIIALIGEHKLVPQAVRQVGDDSSLVQVNIFRNKHDRFPADTVSIGTNQYVWGPNFEHKLPIETPTPTVAAAIAESVKEK